MFQNGRNKLAEAVAIHTEVAWVTMYKNQPSQGEVDLELRSQGFIPHCFAEAKFWRDTDCPGERSNQLLEADVVYVRDFFRVDMDDEQLKQLALIAHHCYRSFDLALRCVKLLEERQAVGVGSKQRYLDALPPESRG